MMIVTRKVLASSFVVLLILVFSMLYMQEFRINYNVPMVMIQNNILDECNTGNFENFDNEKGTNSGCYLVPNIVHFIRFGLENVTFIDAVCILAALKNQNPDKIYIHTDVSMFRGKYWGVLLDTPGFRDKLIINFVQVPTEIFGQTLNFGWRMFHGGDITRLRILMKYGGIFLDNDSYIVRSLDNFRRFEMSLGWMEQAGIANQVIIANKNARFLRKWLESYREYNSSQWYYNAGIKPTKEILEQNPGLIHREKILLANHHITTKLYMEKWSEWKTHYAIHLLIHHQYILHNVSSVATYPVVFDEYNINKYPVTFREMVYDVYPMNKTLKA